MFEQFCALSASILIISEWHLFRPIKINCKGKWQLNPQKKAIFHVVFTYQSETTNSLVMQPLPAPLLCSKLPMNSEYILPISRAEGFLPEDDLPVCCWWLSIGRPLQSSRGLDTRQGEEGRHPWPWGDNWRGGGVTQQEGDSLRGSLRAVGDEQEAVWPLWGVAVGAEGLSNWGGAG